MGAGIAARSLWRRITCEERTADDRVRQGIGHLRRRNPREVSTLERKLREARRNTEWQRLWSEDPAIRDLLIEAGYEEEAKERMLAYLDDLEAGHRAGESDLDRLELAAALDAIQTFKGMLSAENEAVAGVRTFDVLWRVARGEDVEGVQSGFIEEFIHLFRAIRGTSGIGRGWLVDALLPDVVSEDRMPVSGRRAARARSRMLDQIGDAVNAYIDRYPSGMTESVIAQRHRNRNRILTHFSAHLEDWDSSDWQSANVLKGREGMEVLRSLVPLSGEDLASLRLVTEFGLPWGITPYYLSLFDFASHRREADGQVRSQVIPPVHTVRAMIEHRGDREEAFDFMREHDTSPVDYVTRRYPMIAILKVCDTCPQICTYCQRNWEIADAMVLEAIPQPEALEPALAWFAEHTTIRDVLITGGDPLLLEDDRLAWILGKLAEMDHVQHIRIGTRIPVTMPMRITDELATLLVSFVETGRRDLSVVTHIESAYEVTPELAGGIQRLRSKGLRVYNQQVFTVETSRRFQGVATRIALKSVGIDPYYTFYTKGKDEHRDYLVPIARLLQERKEEARLLPGIFRTDETVFNVPGLGKSHLRARNDREWIAIRPDGRRVYLFHPWEKGIAPVMPWPYVDVSIADYLRHLKRLGEDPREYESIWYYR